MTHWQNPWTDAVPVELEDLVECAEMLGTAVWETDGALGVMTRERLLSHWRAAGEKLDAYILPGRPGGLCIGIRYGNEGSDYLSPLANQERTAALLKKASGA